MCNQREKRSWHLEWMQPRGECTRPASTLLFKASFKDWVCSTTEYDVCKYKENIARASNIVGRSKKVDAVAPVLLCTFRPVGKFKIVFLVLDTFLAPPSWPSPASLKASFPYISLPRHSGSSSHVDTPCYCLFLRSPLTLCL